MDFISERVGFTKTSEDLTIYIKGSKKSDLKKINYLKAWVILWALAGFLLIAQFFFSYTIGEARFFLVGLLGFWAYFFYVAIKAYYFRKYGLETIYINNDKFMIRRDVYSKKGKPKWFKANEKNPFSVVEEKSGGINNFFYNSFWVITGGTITFDAKYPNGIGAPGAKNSQYRFGLQLSQEETKKLVSLLNKAIHVHYEKN